MRFHLPGAIAAAVILATAAAHAEPSPSISAPALYDAYEANEIAASLQYGGDKRVVVYGNVSRVDAGFGQDNASIVFEIGGFRIGSVTAKLRPGQLEGAAALTKGQTAVVICMGMEKGILGPEMQWCRLPSQAEMDAAASAAAAEKASADAQLHIAEREVVLRGNLQCPTDKALVVMMAGHPLPSINESTDGCSRVKPGVTDGRLIGYSADYPALAHVVYRDPTDGTERDVWVRGTAVRMPQAKP